jgi:rod shape-determining protein MreD
MTSARALPAPAETALYLGLGLVAVIAPLIPLSPGGGLTPPDLAYGLTVAWVIRRPARLPLWAILLVGLLGDVMLSRPLGLGALGLLLAAEVFRARAATLANTRFATEWLAATLGFAAILAAMQVALTLTLAPAPGLRPALLYLGVTAGAYPLVVLGLTWCLAIRFRSAA